MSCASACAISTPAGPPVGAVSKLFATMADQVTLLSFTPEQTKQANGDFEGLRRKRTGSIPTGRYALPAEVADLPFTPHRYFKGK